MFGNYSQYAQDGMKGFYSPEFMIDTLQKTKGYATDKIITDPKLNELAHNFMNAQSAFAKMLVNNATEITKISTDNITKAWNLKAK